VASHCLGQSDADTLWSVPECTTAEKLQASLKHNSDTEQAVSWLL
jgi:hypothetical protein